MDRKTFGAREVIFREGEYQKWMYSVLEGSVDIYSGFGTEAQKKLAKVTPGQFFGEIGMIGMVPRTATAVAAEETVLELVEYEALEEYVKTHPENLMPIMQNVSRRTRELTAELTQVNRTAGELLSKKTEDMPLRTFLADSVKKMSDRLRTVRNAAVCAIPKPTEEQLVNRDLPPVAKFRRGDVIFREGDRAQCLYEVYGGCVGIYADHGTANAKLLARLNNGDVFGEMGILDDLPRSATAVCLEDCSLLIVKKEHFLRFFQNKPVKILAILQQMCMRLRQLSVQYLQVCTTLEELSSREAGSLDTEKTWSRIRQISEPGHKNDVSDTTAAPEETRAADTK